MRAESTAYLRAAASDLLTVGLDALARWLSCDLAPVSTADSHEAEAAALLGIDCDADEAEVRAALRSKIFDGHLHPDHGGDGVQARELIAAQNLLIVRARRRRAGGIQHA
jgi:hypothetical protein